MEKLPNVIKRSEYMDGKYSFNEYYRQFVTPEILDRVSKAIGVDRIKASTDEHLNDIPMKEWDAIFGGVFRSGQIVVQPTVPRDIMTTLKEADEIASMATLCCIAKQAARKLIE